jgi:hypothetical protein
LITLALADPTKDGGAPLPFLVPFLAGIGGLAVSFVRGKMRWVGGTIAGLVGVAALLLLLLSLLAQSGEAAGLVHFGAGYYLMLVLFIGAVALNVILLLEGRKHARGPLE